MKRIANLFIKGVTPLKRRDFIKSTAIAGVSGFLAQGHSSMAKSAKTSDSGFDVHPFVKNHPEAVFIYLTDVKSKRDTSDIRDAGHKLAKELIVKTPSGGYPNSTKITIKPNWCSARPRDGKPVYENLGVNTDPNFVEGWVQGMKKVGPEKYYIRECSHPNQWEPMGYRAMTDRNGIIHISRRTLKNTLKPSTPDMSGKATLDGTDTVVFSLELDGRDSLVIAMESGWNSGYSACLTHTA